MTEAGFSFAAFSQIKEISVRFIAEVKPLEGVVFCAVIGVGPVFDTEYPN